jgi:PAS domain S-box-containing protein
MTQELAAGAQGAGMEGLLAGNAGLLFVLGVGLTALAVLLFLLLLLSRRQQRRDMREVVLAVESLRTGRAARPAELDPRSPFVVLADAVNMLGQDLAARAVEAEGRGEGFRALQDAARDLAVVTADADFDLRGLSAGAAALLGWEEGEVLGRPAAVLFDEAAWKDLLPKLGRRNLREHGVEARSVLLRRDGSRFHGSVRVRLIAGSAGEARGYLFVVKDVDEDVRLEQELRQSEARYRGVVEAIPEAVVVLRGGRIAHLNVAMAEMLGGRAEELVGVPLRDRVATRDVMKVQEHLARLERCRAGERLDLHVTLVSPDGRGGVDVRLSLAAALVDGSAAVVGTVADETAARRLEAEIRRNESRLDAVLEATTDAVVSLADLPGGAMVRMTNRAFLDLFGLREGQVLGATEGDLLRLLRERGGGAEEVAAFLAAASRGTRRETCTLGPAPARALELTASPLLDRTGAPLGRILVCRDASRETAEGRRLEGEAESLRAARVDAEASYRRLAAVHEALEAKSRETERLNRELRTLDRMKTNLLANVTHELQTPLVSVRGYTEMILKERLGAINEEQRKGLGLSLKNIDRLISMIDNLLAFARMDREAAELKISVFSLSAIIEECRETLRAKVEARRIRLTASFEDPGIVVNADREKVLQVFLNVVSNAVKFNRDGGEIRVEVRKGKAGFAAVQVKDTGIGIPEEDLERIFDRFYRVGAGSGESQEGTGLGLSIVRNILRLHGCSIRAESQVGRGTAFTFTLPLAAAEAGLEEERGTASPRPPALESPPPPEPPPPRAPEPERRSPATGDGSPSPRPRFRIIRRS